MTINANAKLNLSLDIVGKRGDGYHDIVSEMQEIDLADIVTVNIVGSGISIICDNPEIPADNRNIAYRAAELFFSESNISSGADIHIQKRIPLMAGLGGGSADGAAVLKALNKLLGKTGAAAGAIKEPEPVFSESELIKLGARLGADVPFCLTGGRAECRGIGEIITPLPDLPPQYYAVIRPDFCCNTKQAYEIYSANKHNNPGFKRTKANVFQDLYNDERIERICDELIDSGAVSASMSGSGSAVFGVFTDLESAESALEGLDYPFKNIAGNVRRQA